MNGFNETENLPDPWHATGQRFRILVVLAMLAFVGFAFYDGQQFHARYFRRCEEAPDRSECRYLGISRPKNRANLGIIIDNDSGKWALQIAVKDEKTADERASQLWDAGANPRIIRVSGRKRYFYYLQLGRFKSQKDALRACAQLSAKRLFEGCVVAEFKPQ